MTTLEADVEIIRCSASPSYFVWHFITVKDETTGKFVPFHLWPAQQQVLAGFCHHRLCVLLKARQLGQTTLVIAYAIWLALFKPNSTILLFSKSQKEARDLIRRVRGTTRRLPRWLQPRACVTDSTEELEFSNGSKFVAFASRSSQGDSFTATLAIVDEADLIPDLNELLSGVKPTIDAGGQLILLSRSEKSNPESPFKQVYRAALAGRNGYWHKFLPWQSRPGRTQQWYDAIRNESLARTGSLDEVWEQYPATPDEALAARQLDKRLPLKWLESCFTPLQPIPVEQYPESAPLLPGLRVFRLPEAGRQYLIGCDPAEGNPNSDDSVSSVVERVSLEQVAILCGKMEPGILANHTADLAKWFNSAAVMVERNNHGFTVLQELRQCHQMVTVLSGIDGKPGWLTTARSKVEMYNVVAENARCGAFLVHDRDTFKQLADIEASTLRAPSGLHDDLAMAFSLAVAAAEKPAPKFEASVLDLYGKGAPVEQREEGINYIPVLDAYSAAIEGKDKSRLGLGTYQSHDQARYAQDFARHLLGIGQEPSQEDVAGVEKVQSKVRQKLQKAGAI